MPEFPFVILSLCNRMASALISTACTEEPISIVMSPHVAAAFTVSPERTEGLNPSRSTRMLSSPTARLGAEKAPDSLDSEVKVELLDVFVIVTFAPRMAAPLTSNTHPEMAPRSLWANISEARMNRQASGNAARLQYLAS